jgi:hypothetical protein
MGSWKLFNITNYNVVRSYLKIPKNEKEQSTSMFVHHISILLSVPPSGRIASIILDSETQ